MRFLLDQDVYATTAGFLEQLGHDLVPVAQMGLSGASDEELLRVAQKQGRILVTRDRDYVRCTRLRGAARGCGSYRAGGAARRREPDRVP